MPAKPPTPTAAGVDLLLSLGRKPVATPKPTPADPTPTPAPVVRPA
jgi:hypothetical protein